MADKIVVKAEQREGRGKNDSRRLRVAGKIPVSVYGGGEGSLAAAANLRELAKILRTDAGVNSVFSLDIEGVGVSDVIFQDRQICAVKGRLLHADLRRIGKGEKMEMTVPLHLVGNAPGLNEEGAVINQPMHEIKVLCEPANVPDAIEIDVSNLNAGESIHVSDLKVGAGIEILESPDTVIATIGAVRAEVAEPIEAGEPEVIGKEPESK